MNENIILFNSLRMHMDVNSILLISLCVHIKTNKILFISLCAHIKMFIIDFTIPCVHINGKQHGIIPSRSNENANPDPSYNELQCNQNFCISQSRL